MVLIFEPSAPTVSYMQTALRSEDEQNRLDVSGQVERKKEKNVANGLLP